MGASSPGYGGAWRHWEKVWATNPESPIPVLNNATLLQPLTEAEVPALRESLDAFFGDSRSDAYAVFSLWPHVRLDAAGFERVNALSLMVRPPGGSGAPTASLQIETVEAIDESSVLAADSTLVHGYPLPALIPYLPGVVWDTRVVGRPEFKIWVAIGEDGPAATAASYVHSGVVGVYWVATRQEVRRRGYGEAVSWRATRVDPQLPAVLEASEMGKPLYERMGYKVVGKCDVWQRSLR